MAVALGTLTLAGALLIAVGWLALVESCRGAGGPGGRHCSSSVAWR